MVIASVYGTLLNGLSTTTLRSLSVRPFFNELVKEINFAFVVFKDIFQAVFKGTPKRIACCLNELRRQVQALSFRTQLNVYLYESFQL